MEAAIPFAIIIGFCASIFIVIGIYALKKKTPMHFWAGTTVKSKEMDDFVSEKSRYIIELLKEKRKVK